MADISAELVKELRERTGAGFMDCKKALDRDRTATSRRPRPCCASVAWPRRPRRPAATPARASSARYIHTGGRFGALIEVNCETDFVARNEQFQQLVKDLAIQVVALRPEYPSIESIPADVLAAKKAELLADESVQKKPENIREQIVDGQLKKWYQQVVLTEQPYPRHRPDRRPAHHECHRHDRREHPCATLRPVRGRGGAVSDARDGDPRDGRRRRCATAGSCSSCPARRSSAIARTASIRPSAPSSPRQVAEHPRDGRPDRHRRRRRQHLPRPRGLGPRAWTARPATTSACSRRS